MKKVIALFLVICLCGALCACGRKNSKTPKDWDRIAEATATLNAYYACETVEELSDFYHSSYSDSDIKMLAEYWSEYREARGEEVTKEFVRKIKYIDTYKGCDVFLVAQGYESKDGYRTPTEQQPMSKAGLYTALPTASFSLNILTIENGRYVFPNMNTDVWQKYSEDFSFCTCDLGTVVIPGDPCKSCDGAGYLAEESNDDSEVCVNDDSKVSVNDDSVFGVCLTCGGDGILDDETSCSDCMVEVSELLPLYGALVNVAEQEACPDCDGTGLENYTYGDCPDCGGKGYNK